jgi:hypothetical protein
MGGCVEFGLTSLQSIPVDTSRLGVLRCAVQPEAKINDFRHAGGQEGQGRQHRLHGGRHGPAGGPSRLGDRDRGHRRTPGRGRGHRNAPSHAPARPTARPRPTPTERRSPPAGRTPAVPWRQPRPTWPEGPGQSPVTRPPHPPQTPGVPLPTQQRRAAHRRQFPHDPTDHPDPARSPAATPPAPHRPSGRSAGVEQARCPAGGTGVGHSSPPGVRGHQNWNDSVSPSSSSSSLSLSCTTV